MNQQFKDIVESDIKTGREIVEKHDVSKCGEFHKNLLSKYSPIITDFGGNLYSLFYDDDNSHCLSNINTMVEKLELFRAMGYENKYDKAESGVSIQNQNINTNTNSMTINISFEEVRKQVENMTALPDSEMEEILSRISDLEMIVQSNDRRSKKWEKAKDIIKWIADKGVDVGIALLPLFLKI